MIPASSNAFTRRQHAEADSPARSARSWLDMRPSRCSSRSNLRSDSLIFMDVSGNLYRVVANIRQNSPKFSKNN